MPDEWIPVIMAVVGGILGAAGMGVIPDFPATDYITAVAVGMFNGLAATGVNQLYKQSKSVVEWADEALRAVLSDKRVILTAASITPS
ncbi:MAG: phage holin family protein [Clostridium fessum]